MSDSLENYFIEQENPLYSANVQISAHTIDGWYGMYLRMIRFYNRAKNSENSIDELDFYIVFFQNCFHLKDWIIGFKSHKDSNSSSKIWSSKIHELINNSYSLKISRDVCNGLKHLKLNNPSIDKSFSIFYESRPFHEIDKVKDTGWSIFISENPNDKNPKRNYMEVVAKDCVDTWNKFLVREGLLSLK